MKGIIVEFNATQRPEDAKLICIIKMESIMSIEEYNELGKSFEEGLLKNGLEYHVTRNGHHISFKRTDK